MERVSGTDRKKNGEKKTEKEIRTTNTLFFALHPGRPHLCQGSRLSLRGSSWWRTEMPNNLSEIRRDAPTTLQASLHLLQQFDTLLFPL